MSFDISTTATSLLEILSSRAQSQPTRQAYIFLQDGETESGSLTYGELDRQARAIAEPEVRFCNYVLTAITCILVAKRFAQ